MIQIGADILTQLAEDQIHHAKLVFNDRGFIAFPTTIQHNTMKDEGISYEDNYLGNAMAAMLKPDAIEVRYHRACGDGDVATIIATLFERTALSAVRHASVTYRGRSIGTADTRE